MVTIISRSPEKLLVHPLIREAHSQNLGDISATLCDVIG